MRFNKVTLVSVFAQMYYNLLEFYVKAMLSGVPVPHVSWILTIYRKVLIYSDSYEMIKCINISVSCWTIEHNEEMPCRCRVEWVVDLRFCQNKWKCSHLILSTRIMTRLGHTVSQTSWPRSYKTPASNDICFLLTALPLCGARRFLTTPVYVCDTS